MSNNISFPDRFATQAKFSIRIFKIMLRTFLPLFLILFSFTGAFAQGNADLIAKLNKSAPDTNRVEYQLRLANYYMRRPGKSSKDLDSAAMYIRSATNLCETKGFTDALHVVLTIDGVFNLVKKDFSTADILFNRVAQYYHNNGNKLKEARTWEAYGNNILYDDVEHRPVRRLCYDNAYKIYAQTTDRFKTALALKNVADVDINSGALDKAEAELTTVIDQFMALKYIRTYDAYFLLGQVYSRKNEPKKQLVNMLECINGYEADPNRKLIDGHVFYYTTAVAYSYEGDFELSQLYARKNFDIAIALDSRVYYYEAMSMIASCYLKFNKARDGLAFVKKAIPRYPPKTEDEQKTILTIELKLYNFLGGSGLTEAKKIIPEFLKVYDHSYQLAKADPTYIRVNTFISGYSPILAYYSQTKEWDKLSAELIRLRSLPSKNLTVYSQTTIKDFQFKADSADKKYAAALIGYKTSQDLKNSLNNAAASRQIHELEAKYRSATKDKAIESLNKLSAIREGKLAQINMQRNITLVGVAISIILAVLIYIAYRSKQRSNRSLEVKQEEINSQNRELSFLLSEKEKLIVDKDDLLHLQESLICEKEWLLKEVHHRVKNNLQIVMSLLYTQSAYLKNNAAIEALKDSQNRVHAISIIHQKLYSKTNVATVVLAEYIEDLVRYLRSAFDTDKARIRFHQDVAIINLDIAQAVPVGLIINEAVTNCIKYAFAGNGGEITIESRLAGDDIVLLSITDNGRGLPAGFDISKTTSLGMEMMKALCKQLDGSLHITDDGGVLITIRFMIENTLSKEPEQRLLPNSRMALK